jgi:hypothetical protein
MSYVVARFLVVGVVSAILLLFSVLALVLSTGSCGGGGCGCFRAIGVGVNEILFSSWT